MIFFFKKKREDAQAERGRYFQHWREELEILRMVEVLLWGAALVLLGDGGQQQC